MFSWFKPKEDVYRPKERMIFSYFDGDKVVRADPLALYKRVMDMGPSLSIDSAVAISQSSNATKAQNELIANIRSIFLLRPLNGIDCTGTLTDIETLNLLDEFMHYTETLKKNSRISRTASTVSADSKTIAKEDQATSNISDSGSIDNESSTDVQQSSPTDKRSP